jgi:hypothetical protein
VLIINSDRMDQENQLDEVYLISAHYQIASCLERQSSGRDFGDCLLHVTIFEEK